MHPREDGKQSVRDSDRRWLEITGTTTSYKCAGNEGGETNITSMSHAVSAEGYSL